MKNLPIIISRALLVLTPCLLAGCGFLGSDRYPIVSVTDGPFTVRAECRQVTAGTVAPYATIHRSNLEIASIMVNSGYDLPNDCLKGSIETVELDKPTNSLMIRMKSGEVKNLHIIGTNLSER